MIRTFTAVAAVFYVTTASGCGAGDGAGLSLGAGQSRQAIVKGAPSDASQEAVVRLDMKGVFACTATMVAPNLALTARHCVAEITESGVCGEFTANAPPSALSIAVGIDAKSTGVKGVEIFTESGTDACVGDIALIKLASDVPNAKVAKVRLSKLTEGEGALTVGYGDDGTGSSFESPKPPPRAQRTGLKIDAIGPKQYDYATKSGAPIPVDLSEDEIATGESTCVGDSGGPLFDQSGAIIGVTSRGVDDECFDRPSIYAAVSAHEALVKKAFDAAGQTLEEPAAPAPGPATVDPTPPPAAAPPPAPASAPAPTMESSDGCAIGGNATPSSYGLFALPFALALVRRRRRR